MPKTIGLVVTPPSANPATELRMRLLKVIAAQNADSAHVVIALADILALTAATLDLHAGRRSLDDRLGSFEARVRETYLRAHHDMKIVSKD